MRQIKGNQKDTPAQIGPETPEQKEIRLLKKRLEKAKREEEWYSNRWREESAAHRKTKTQLAYADIYKTMAETAKIQNDTLLSMYDKSEKSAADWKAKYQALLNQKPVVRSEESKALGVSDTVLGIHKRIGEICNRGRGQSESETAVRRQIKIVYLICINTDVIEKRLADGLLHNYHGSGLEYLERYTAYEITDHESGLRYLLNELPDDPKLCERFVRSTKKAHFQARKK